MTSTDVFVVLESLVNLKVDGRLEVFGILNFLQIAYRRSTVDSIDMIM